MRVASIHIGHDASASFFDGENLAYFLQERYSRVKHDSKYFYCLDKLLDIGKKIDLFVISAADDSIINVIENDGYFKNFLIDYKKKHNSNLNIIYEHSHHLYHASLAFYNSGFDKSLIIVVDGFGKNEGSIRECESVYVAEYPNIFNPIIKNYLIAENDYEQDLNTIKNQYLNCEVNAKSKIGIAGLYGSCASHFGESDLSAGKIMGLQSYGSKSSSNFIKDKFYVLDEDFFIDHKKIRVYNRTIPVTNLITEKNYKIYSDYGKDLQLQTESMMIELIKKSIDSTGVSNVCITGGYGMNVIANSRYKTEFSNINFYNEPLSSDCGITLGSCFYHYRDATKDMNIKSITNPYFHGQLTKLI